VVEKELIVSITNIFMCICFITFFFRRHEVDDYHKKDFNFFAPLGIMTTFMGFLYHYLRSTGKTVQETQLLWDFILYTTVFMSFFYTAIAVKVFSSSEKVLYGWKLFCKIKAVLFIGLQYNIQHVKVYYKDIEIVIFLISSLLPVCYLFIGFLCNLKEKKFHFLGLASFIYLSTVVNRLFGSDFGNIFNENSLMHLGIIILLTAVFFQIKKKEIKV